MSYVDVRNETKEKGNESEDVDEISQEELVDPRVQIELERLNTATDLINKLEIELDEARSNFRLLLSESSVRVNQLAKKLGSCVEKARPYYEARMHAKQLQTHTQKAALRYERASSAHCAAKEMVYLAEEGLKKEGRCFDPAWQEMLNHATLRVNEAESERILSQHEHQKASLSYNEAEKIVQHLHQEMKKSIVKSSLSTRRSLLQLNNLVNQHQLQLLPYFEMKAQFNQLLEEQRKKVHHLEENVLKIKMSYADALHNLEEISDEIHQKRKSQENQLQSSENHVESPNFSHDHQNASFHNKTEGSKLSNEDPFNTEDIYMSLPSKLKYKPGMIPMGCIENNSEITDDNFSYEDKYMSLPSKFKLNTGMISSDCIEVEPQNVEGTPNDDNSSKNHKNDQKCNEDTSFISSSNNQKGDIEVSSKGPCLFPHDSEELNASKSKSETIKSEELFEKSPECELPDFKFLAPDCNLLRVQREELSDSESLGSNDTTDTLDDNQIECLLLEKMLPVDMQDTDSENPFINFNQKTA